MSERKVLNKYYPPDFDPSKLPRLKLARDRQYVVRLMAPCNMKCTTCGEYIYKGKKFNARKETVQGDEYLGIKIFRFYIRCPRCLAEITFKTNPKDADYDLEHGATRNFQALQTAEKLEEAARLAEEEEDKNNPMKMLEKRTMQSRIEMERIEALEELKELNERHSTVDFEGMLGRNYQQSIETEEERAQREEREIQHEVEQLLMAKGVEKRGDGVTLRRVRDIDSDEEEERLKKVSRQEDPLVGARQIKSGAGGSGGALSKLKGLVRVKKTETSQEKAISTVTSAKSQSTLNGTGEKHGSTKVTDRKLVDASGSSGNVGAPGASGIAKSNALGLVLAYSDSDGSD